MKPRILVVDQPSIARLYQEEFEDEGYEVRVASRGSRVLAAVESFEPDLVTLDIKMPGMDGIETLRALKEQRRDLLVVLCTGHDELAADFGFWVCDACVMKSSNLNELKSTVRRLLRRAAA